MNFSQGIALKMFFEETEEVIRSLKSKKWQLKIQDSLFLIKPIDIKYTMTCQDI
jgi:hypothetical protein